MRAVQPVAVTPQCCANAAWALTNGHDFMLPLRPGGLAGAGRVRPQPRIERGAIEHFALEQKVGERLEPVEPAGQFAMRRWVSRF